mmetsp:Transcript_115715/g.332392  ORF Transcript_115715/g.332392 Transcript_115715/m.332392 type:complete len:203 (-) Transcript_115715:750-1358(-)
MGPARHFPSRDWLFVRELHPSDDAFRRWKNKIGAPGRNRGTAGRAVVRDPLAAVHEQHHRQAQRGPGVLARAADAPRGVPFMSGAAGGHGHHHRTHAQEHHQDDGRLRLLHPDEQEFLRSGQKGRHGGRRPRGGDDGEPAPRGHAGARHLRADAQPQRAAREVDGHRRGQVPRLPPSPHGRARGGGRARRARGGQGLARLRL